MMQALGPTLLLFALIVSIFFVLQVSPIGLFVMLGGIVLGLIYLKRNSLSASDIYGSTGRRRDWLMMLKLAPAFIILSIGIGHLFLILLTYLNPLAIEEQLTRPEAQTQTPGFTLLALVVAPIVEETLFRGIIFPLLSLKWKVTNALLFSSLIFGLLHLNLPGAFIFSLLATTLYVTSSSLYVPIVLHFINNLVAVSLTLLAPINAANLSQIREGAPFSVLMTLIGGFFIFRFLKNNWPKRLPDFFHKETPGAEIESKKAA